MVTSGCCCFLENALAALVDGEDFFRDIVWPAMVACGSGGSTTNSNSNNEVAM